MIAFLIGTQTHGDDVGSGTRFTHGKRAHMFTGNELWQVVCLLGRRAMAHNLVDAEIGMGAVGETDRGRCT